MFHPFSYLLVLHGERDLSYCPGKQGGDDQGSVLLGALESGGLLLSVRDNESTLVVEVGDPSIVQGGDEKPEAVIVEADIGGSSAVDAVGSPSVIGGQPPIRQALVAIGKCTQKAAVCRGQTTDSP